MVSVQDTAAHRQRAGASAANRGGGRLQVAVVAGAVLVVIAGTAVGIAVAGSGPPGPPPAAVGTSFDRAVPAAVLGLPLVDERGVSTSLAAYRGKALVVVPFLTSCQEVCPISTGVVLQVQRSLTAAGVAGTTAVLMVSVDPGRDAPARLAAYAHVTGATWPLLTGTSSALDALWRFFGIEHTVVPEGSPPGTDWQTGQPYTYDVDHSDGFVLLDARGHERFATGGMPKDAAGLPRALHSMLDAQGRANLAAPGPGSWTAADVLQGLGWLLGRPLPARS